jgi:hypothetical protein
MPEEPSAVDTLLPALHRAAALPSNKVGSACRPLAEWPNLLSMGEVAVERRQQMFPRLSDAQIERIMRHGVRRYVEADEVLFAQGDAGLGIHVVLSASAPAA